MLVSAAVFFVEVFQQFPDIIPLAKRPRGLVELNCRRVHPGLGHIVIAAALTHGVVLTELRSRSRMSTAPLTSSANTSRIEGHSAQSDRSKKNR